MTDAGIDAMEAGAACDMAVGQAVGLLLQGNNRTGVSLVLGNDASAKFEPSRFWNDAMYAAEMCGLLRSPSESRVLCELGGIGSTDRWAVVNLDCMRLGDTVAIAPTGPLAICRAILKLSRKETT